MRSALGVSQASLGVCNRFFKQYHQQKSIEGNMNVCMCFRGENCLSTRKNTMKAIENGVHSRGSRLVEINSRKRGRLPYISHLQQVSEARNPQKIQLTWGDQVGRPALPCNPSSYDVYLSKLVPKYLKTKSSKAELKIHCACRQIGFFPLPCTFILSLYIYRNK